MKRSIGWKRRFTVLALGGIPLITTASCDPYSGVLSIFRDDDYGYYGGYYYDEIIIYEDCFFDCW